MLKHIPIPPSFSLIRKGKILALLKDGYRDVLLKQGIDNLENFFKKNTQISHFHEGRTPHPSLPLSEEKRMILRRYSHGGLLRAITGNLYCFGARSFSELALTEKIRICGIPTIEPIGAIHQKTGFPLFYRAYLLTIEVPGALNAIQYLEKTEESPSRDTLLRKRKMIRDSGLLLHQFHRAGFFHQDLQLKNILVAGDRILIIDFDRSYGKPVLTARERMKNLLRLNRSVEKWRRSGLPISRTDRWRFFSAYAGEDKVIRELMKKALRHYLLRSLFYRM